MKVRAFKKAKSRCRPPRQNLPKAKLHNVALCYRCAPPKDRGRIITLCKIAALPALEPQPNQRNKPIFDKPKIIVMKPSTPYDDLQGIVTADVSNLTTSTNSLKELAEYFKIDVNRYDVVGLETYGVGEFFVKLIAIDKEKSTDEKEYLVQIAIDDQENLQKIFKDLHIIVMDRFRQEYLEREVDAEIEITED